MRRFFIAMMVAVLSVVTMSARDRYSRNVSDLPTAAQSFIQNNFKAKVSLIKIDKGTFGGTDYDVVLTDGSELEFDGKGNWKEIEVPRGKQVPNTIVPAGAQTYIKANHKGSKVLGIERDRSGYKVTLDNGIEMMLSNRGDFLRYDD